MTSEEQRTLGVRIRDLEERLAEASQTLAALRHGEVDAIVAQGPGGDQVYVLTGADAAYRIMVQHMGEGALTVAPDGLILFSNEQFARLPGIPLEQVIGAQLRNFAIPEDRGTVDSLLLSRAGGKAEVRLSRQGASPVPVYLSLRHVEINGAACYCAIVTDLSEQKRYQEIAAVLEAVPAGVFIAQDAGCRSIVGNRRAWDMLGMPPDMGGKPMVIEREASRPWREVKDGRDIPQEDLPLQFAARTGEPVGDYEFELLFDDGASRAWLGNAVPLLDKQGQSRGAVAAFVDITERKLAAEALDASNAELRGLGRALTKDLREPLGMVVKFTRILARDSGAAPQETLVSDALGAALRIEALLNSLAEYWEVTERPNLSLEAVDCHKVLEQTLQHLHPAIREFGATVTCADLPVLVADNVMLSHLLRTLVGNALQYRNSAPPVVHVCASRNYDRWLFSVRDNGIGIDPQDAGTIFQMFSRLHGSEIPGTGVGLALCRKIVERHGGRIWVESRKGEGAAFRFTIPTFLGSSHSGFSLSPGKRNPAGA